MGLDVVPAAAACRQRRLEDSFALYPGFRHDLVTDIMTCGLTTREVKEYLRGLEKDAYQQLLCNHLPETTQLLDLRVYRGISKLLVGKLLRHKNNFRAKVLQGCGRQGIRFSRGNNNVIVFSA